MAAGLLPPLFMAHAASLEKAAVHTNTYKIYGKSKIGENEGFSLLLPTAEKTIKTESYRFIATAFPTPLMHQSLGWRMHQSLGSMHQSLGSNAPKFGVYAPKFGVSTPPRRGGMTVAKKWKNLAEKCLPIPKRLHPLFPKDCTPYSQHPEPSSLHVDNYCIGGSA